MYNVISKLNFFFLNFRFFAKSEPVIRSYLLRKAHLMYCRKKIEFAIFPQSTVSLYLVLKSVEYG